MSIKNIIKQIFFVLILSNAMANAVFYDAIDHWIRNDGEQEIFCFSDFHSGCRNVSISKNQQHQLINWAKNLNAFIIVEDMLDDLKTSENVECFRKFNLVSVWPDDHLIGGLTTRCRNNNIAHVNVECRFWQVGFYSQLKKYRKHDIELYKYNELIDYLYQMTMKEDKKNQQVIQDYCINDDNETLKKFYNEILISRQNYLDKFCETRFSDYLTNENYNGLFTLFENFIKDFAVKYVDANIVHEIYKNKKTKYIFICAGGFHIENISNVLPQIGFKKLDPIVDPVGLAVFLNEKCAVNVNAFFNLCKPEYKKNLLLKYAMYSLLGYGIYTGARYLWKYYYQKNIEFMALNTNEHSSSKSAFSLLKTFGPEHTLGPIASNLHISYASPIQDRKAVNSQAQRFAKRRFKL